MSALDEEQGPWIVPAPRDGDPAGQEPGCAAVPALPAARSTGENPQPDAVPREMPARQTTETATGFTVDVQVAMPSLLARLDRIEQRLEDVDRGGQEALAEALAALEKQVVRAGREQFKASALAEAQRDELRTVMEALRLGESQREAALDRLRQESAEAVRQAGTAIIQDLLPVLDGLDESLRAGRRLLDAPPPAPPRRSWFWRVPEEPAEGDELRETMRAWVTGLEFVRERLLQVLADEDVQVIAHAGEPFDPDIHHAVEASKATAEMPAHTVSAVVRQGYRQGSRVLRAAEVAVTRDQ